MNAMQKLTVAITLKLFLLGALRAVRCLVYNFLIKRDFMILFHALPSLHTPQPSKRRREEG
jgi:hypothetical protein